MRGLWQEGRRRLCPDCAPQAQRFEETSETLVAAWRKRPFEPPTFAPARAQHLHDRLAQEVGANLDGLLDGAAPLSASAQTDARVRVRP